MISHNIAKEKADLLEKEALSLLPKDKENPSDIKRILSIKQWLIGEAEINLLETDTVSSAFLLAQKWPFDLLKGEKFVAYAFMAGNDTLSKGKSMGNKNAPKSKNF